MGIRFTYRNHRGEVEQRFITNPSIEFIRQPGYGYQPGWFISGYCVDRGARRSFALTHIQLPDDPRPNAIFILMEAQ